MIMSLKAASLGLNMVAACHVLLLDLWWNPTTEDQAIDRAHRIGQTRPVTVLRLTVRDTVEDRILALQVINYIPLTSKPSSFITKKRVFYFVRMHYIKPYCFPFKKLLYKKVYVPRLVCLSAVKKSTNFGFGNV